MTGAQACAGHHAGPTRRGRCVADGKLLPLQATVLVAEYAPADDTTLTAVHLNKVACCSGCCLLGLVMMSDVMIDV